ncbi:MAG: CHAT domain-containing protein [Leptolyngbyaceae bacterium]|nr:CHAT domain-containing protein [Leptolyngbyaceae bacterium]
MTQEFHISVTPVGEDEYLVRTEQVAPGVPLAEEQLVWPVEAWLSLARQLDPRQIDPRQTEPMPDFLTLGQQLYSALFQGTLRDSWMTAQGIAQHQREQLRLCLGIKGSRLARLPWEMLYADARPLATSPDIIFSRYQSTTGLLYPTLDLETDGMDIERPIRILLAIAVANSQECLEFKRQAIQLQAELLNGQGPSSSLSGRYTSGNSIPGVRDLGLRDLGLRRELPTLEIQLTILEQPDRTQLTQALEQGQYQILHYIGHSPAGVAGGDLGLINHKTGLPESLSGDDLAGLLVNNGVRMALLNFCRRASTLTTMAIADTRDQDLAATLVKRGVPGVLTLADNLPDSVTLNLTRLFYRYLSQGLAIDLSLSRARQWLLAHYGMQQWYWALPILYLRPGFEGYVSDRPRLETLRSTAFVAPLPLSSNGQTVAPVPFCSESLQQILGIDLEIPVDSSIVEPQNFEEEEAKGQFGLMADFDEGEAFDDDEVFDDGEAYDDDEESSYGEDSELVSGLLRQLSQANLDSNPMAEEPMILASEDENLLPHAEIDKAWVYDDFPENPLYAQGRSPDPALQEPVLASEQIPSPVMPKKVSLKPSRFLTASAPSQNPDHPKNSGFQEWLEWGGVVGVVGLAAVVSSSVGFLWSLSPQLPFKQTSSPSPAATDRSQSPSPSPQQNLETRPMATDLQVMNSAKLTALAIAAFERGNLLAGQQAVETLLDRNALKEAEVALLAIPDAQLQEPTVSFLRGRLAWQAAKAANSDYTLQDAQQAWEAAIRRQPNQVLYHNALGLAYYAQGNLSQADQAWFQALYLLETQPTPTPQSPQATTQTSVPGETSLQQETLTAYAGLALVLARSAQSQLAAKRAGLLSKATKLHQKVMKDDPIGFQPEALRKNWMWTEQMIQEWRSLIQE